MGRRRDQRQSLVLPVRVSGTDIDGKPFSQTSCTLDLNPRGAKLYGVRCLKGQGDIITLQYKKNRARFEVVWVGEPRSSRDGQLGVRNLDYGKNFWGFDLDYNPVDDFVIASQYRPSDSLRSDEAETSSGAAW